MNERNPSARARQFDRHRQEPCIAAFKAEGQLVDQHNRLALLAFSRGNDVGQPVTFGAAA